MVSCTFLYDLQVFIAGQFSCKLYHLWHSFFTFPINSCSSNLYFLIEGQRLILHWLVPWLVLLFLYQCFVLGCCSRQIQQGWEIWCRSQALYSRVHYFLDSSAEVFLATRKLSFFFINS